jgi:hypothetical protein
MKKIPSDRAMLQAIYDRYKEQFEQNAAADKIMIPIDCVSVGKQLKVDAHLVFGRLYYHLEQKYGYTRPGSETRVALFSPVAGHKANCVNFPLLASVLAGLQEEQSKQNWSLGLSIASIVIALIALLGS